MSPEGKPVKLWYRFRGMLMAPPLVLCLLSTHFECEIDLLVFPLAGTLFATGLLLRVWAQMHLHYRLKVHKVMTTSGPYAYVRNPIYIANTLILAGCVAMSELIWFVPVMLIWCAFIYSMVVRYEESHLIEKYGEQYAEYLKRVPRWWPAFLRPGLKGRSSRATRYLFPSILAEAHNLLFLLPFIAKELIHE